MEEIKAGDIMIGNKFIFKDKVVEVAGISGAIRAFGHQDVTIYFPDKEICEMHSIKNIRPIPLTEDILQKAGFRKHKMSGYDTHFIYSLFIGGETIGITAIYNADFSIMLHGVARGVKYLHRLQNIIKIVTGNELEINL